jgi:peptidoglycan/LPS O-acetylase OafA/YrhL
MGVHFWIPQWHPGASAILALAPALCVSVAINRFVEKPSARLRQRLARRSPVAGAAAVR